MKRIVCAVIVLLLLLSISACEAPWSQKGSTVAFYYCTNSAEYSPDQPAILAEDRQKEATDLERLLNQYFQGPITETLHSPFPANLHVDSVQVQDGCITVVLPATFTALTGYKRMVACSCIAKTILEASGCQQVTIEAGAPDSATRFSITLSQADILLIDNAKSTQEVAS